MVTVQKSASIVFGIAVVISAQASAIPRLQWTFLNCETSLSDLNKTIDKEINDKKITRGRDLGQYIQGFSGRLGVHDSAEVGSFGPWTFPVAGNIYSLKEIFPLLNDGGDRLWIDGGGGDGIALKDFLKDSTNPNLKTLNVSYLSNSESRGQYTVIKGNYLEEIDLGTLRADLITDYFGPFAYSRRPDLVLEKYLFHLKESGVLLLGLGDWADLKVFGVKNKVITKSGEVLRFFEWVMRIPGIKVEIYNNYGPNFLKISVTDLSLVKIPTLNAVAIHDNAPPFFVFAEKGADKDQVLKKTTELLPSFDP